MQDDSTGRNQSEEDVTRRSRLIDYVLLAATLSFAEEFRVDHQRRMSIEALSEVRSVLAARRSLTVELTELETRVARINRSLTARVVDEDAFALVQAYAVLDLRRIQIAVDRIHRHLLTLYPSVSEGLIEQVRGFAYSLRSVLGNEYGQSTRPLSHDQPYRYQSTSPQITLDSQNTSANLLAETLLLADLVHAEID